MTTRKSHKARGATFESDIRDWFRARGYDAERLARACNARAAFWADAAREEAATLRNLIAALKALSAA